MPKLYPEQKQRILNFVIFLGILTIFATALAIYNNLEQNQGETFGIIQIDQDVDVSADAYAEQLNIRIIPDNRTVDESTTMRITISDCNSGAVKNVFNNVMTDITGSAVISLPTSPGLSGNNRIIARGMSHLNKDLGCVNFATVVVDAQFTDPSEYLTPGEVSNVYDNYINSLDASALILNLGTTEEKYDLDLNGTVNTVDMDILGGNIYEQGD